MLKSPDLKLPHFSPGELLGLIFIRDMDDVCKCRAKVACKIVDNDRANLKDDTILLGSYLHYFSVE
jgi:hypothetical protein